MKKKELIIILGSLLVVVLSVTLAYFTTEIFGSGKDISVESTDLKIIFTAGTGTIAGTEIVPGWSSGVNTFTVKNESNSAYKYNIVIKDLVNTFVTKGFLLYKITSTDGGYNMSDFADVPKSTDATDTILAYSVEIAKGTTHTYSVEFKYENSTTEDQSDDMGKILSGTLYIEKGTLPPTLYEQLLADNPTVEERTDFSTAFETNTTNTLYKTTEKNIHNTSDTTVYYFSGSDTTIVSINNWVKFGGFYWRIIRTNADGSVRLLYSGTSPDTTEGYIGTSAFNSTISDPIYVGYMYGTSGSLDNNRTNTNDSTIKGVIDTWYSNNLSSYTKYISTEAVYCNDRNEATTGTYNTGEEQFFFAAYSRLKTNKTPTYDCANSRDAFSASNADAKLTYPIGLMTADETIYAGGSVTDMANSKIWFELNSNKKPLVNAFWWLMTPYIWNEGSLINCYQGHGRFATSLNSDLSESNHIVRPVTSLKSCVLWKSGDGSPENPYEIEETESGC